MPVEAALAAAGGPVAAELRGDFAAARAAAAGDPLAEGVLAVLAGDTARGARLLADDRSPLAAAFRRLAAVPEGPSGMAPPALELGRRAAAAAAGESPPPPSALAASSPAPAAGSSPATPTDASPAATVDFVGSLPGIRRELFLLSLDGNAAAKLEEYLADLPDTPYATLAGAELCRLAGDADRARERLGAALAASDAVGAGLCHLAAGDWLAAPLSSPLAWDFSLEEGVADTSELDWRIEARERAQPPDIAGARAAYAQAAAAVGEAPRAVAALALREGYLALREGDAAAAVAHAERARDGFAAAGDARGARLAATHAALAAVAAGRVPDERAVAEAGAWGAGDGSFGYALGLGLLCARAGRDWRIRAGDAERALAALRLAEVLFGALGADANVIQTLTDRSRVHRDVGDWRTATALLADAVARGLRAAGTWPSLPFVLRMHALAISLGDLASQAGDAGRVGEADGMRDALVARMPALVADWPSLGPLVPYAQADNAMRHGQVAVIVPLLQALDAEARGHDWAVARYSEAALAAAPGTGYMEAIALDTLGHREEARATYLRDLAPPPGEDPERDLAMLVRLEAWPEAAARLPPAPAAGEWPALDDAGQIREFTGDVDGALECYEQAIAALEARRERLTADSLRVAQLESGGAARPFTHAARAALKAGAPGRAFGYAQRAKARALLDLMAASTGLARSEPVRRWREADARLALTRGLLARAAGTPDAAVLDERARTDEAALAAIERELTETEPGWREALRPAARVLALDAVAERLPPGALLLEYVLHDRDVLAFAVTRDGLAGVIRDRGDGRRLAAAMARLWGACYSGHPSWRTLAEPVEAALIAPLAAQIGASSQLLVAPSGTAHRLPFAALRAGGEPLIAGRSLAMLPSASALAVLSDGAPAPGPLLALGAPAGMTYSPAVVPRRRPWGELPWAGAAAAYAASLFPRSRMLLGDDATEAALREDADDYPVVLLATHAEVDESPPRAFVVLANGDGLELHELMGLDLHDAELVVLAACETAGGSVTGGEEVMGLTRGLLAAGAARAIVTLWKTDAASLPLLLRALFSRLAAGAAVAEALRGAQLAVAALNADTAREQRAELRAAAAQAGHPVPDADPRPVDFAHPRHWAPYILVGR